MFSVSVLGVLILLYGAYQDFPLEFAFADKIKTYKVIDILLIFQIR